MMSCCGICRHRESTWLADIERVQHFKPATGIFLAMELGSESELLARSASTNWHIASSAKSAEEMAG